MESANKTANEKQNENIHQQTENQTDEEVEQFLSFLGLKDELYHIFLSKEINSLEKLFNLENYEFNKTVLDEKKRKLISKNLSHIMNGIRSYYHENKDNLIKPSFLQIIRENFYDIDGTSLTKDLLIHSFKLKSMPHNSLPKHLKNENLKPENIFASFLQNKNIAFLKSLDGFKNLKHLYLSDNKIQKLENLNFPNLSILEMSNNYIRRIENLENLFFLQSLNLEKNFISKLENLNENINLETIILNKQILTKNQTFEIIPEGINPRNKITDLQLENCNMYDPSKLLLFPNIKSMKLANNRIFDLNTLLESYKSMQNLNYLTIKNNPFTEINKNYRDYIIIRCGSLEEIDGKTVTQNEKQYVNSLYIRKMLSSRKQTKTKSEEKLKVKPRVKSTSNITRGETLSYLKIKKIMAEETKFFNPLSN
jgi:hypothetical protein